MRRVSGRLWHAVVLVLSCMSISCAAELNNIVCILEAFEMGLPVTLGEGESADVKFKYQQSDEECQNVVATVESADPTTASVGAISTSKGGQSSNSVEIGMDLSTVTAPVTGLKPGGPVQLTLTVKALGTPSQVRTQTVTVMATKGTVNVTITGLPAGLAGDVTVGSALIYQKKFTASGSDRFPAANTVYIANSVSQNGVIYDPTPATGLLNVTAGGTHALNIVYSVRVASTGSANIQLAGLPGGTSGSVTITGNGVNQTVTSSGPVTLQPGTYTVTAATATTTNNEYADPTPSRTITVTAGQTTTVNFAFAIISTLVNVAVTGLEGGLSPSVTLTRGSETRTITSGTSAARLAVGVWTVVMAERVIAQRNYRGRSGNATTLTVLAQTSPMALALAYYCYRWQWQALATFGILSDLYGHNPYVALQLLSHLLTISWLFPEPSSQLRSDGSVAPANQTVTQETVSISGGTGFVSVTGTRAANGAITLTGTGTVAGYPNVPVRLTGTLTGTGAFTGGQYEMGQNTAPTGLPGGSITYSMTAPAPSAAGAIVQEALRAPPRR